MSRILLIAIGGALGAVARYLVQTAVDRHVEDFPAGTLIVNLIGCLLIGLVAGLISEQTIRPELRPFLIVGLLGSFTTFSTYSLESIELLDARRSIALAIYIALSTVGGLAGVWLGLKIAKAVGGA